jgi:hypothetical protein
VIDRADTGLGDGHPLLCHLTQNRGTTMGYPSVSQPHSRRSARMPIRAFLAGKSFDPKQIEVMNSAFRGACQGLPAV